MVNLNKEITVLIASVQFSSLSLYLFFIFIFVNWSCIQNICVNSAVFDITSVTLSPVLSSPSIIAGPTLVTGFAWQLYHSICTTCDVENLLPL